MNADRATIDGFGEEWSEFDQAALSYEELSTVFASYFSVFPWQALPKDATGFDLGCGSGRWARLVALRVGRLHCIDPSEKALAVARKNLAANSNCTFHVASVDEMPILDASMDFGYSLGVLHHVPDTQAGLQACAEKLKPGAPFLVYLYYAFDSRPLWFRTLWKASDLARRRISAMPFRWRVAISTGIATTVYRPFARLSRFAERRGKDVENFPLSFYRDRSFYVMRTDALDRFGTRLEHRFTKPQIRLMMEQAGFERVTFSDAPPYWCAVGYRSSAD
jgi:SAM-dependent methyltransferase